MSETPDFEKLAKALGKELRALISSQENDQTTDHIVARLKELWNARGAADLATIETSLASQMGATASGPYLKNLDRELRKLDR